MERKSHCFILFIAKYFDNLIKTPLTHLPIIKYSQRNGPPITLVSLSGHLIEIAKITCWHFLVQTGLDKSQVYCKVNTRLSVLSNRYLQLCTLILNRYFHFLTKLRGAPRLYMRPYCTVLFLMCVSQNKVEQKSDNIKE